MSDGYQPQTHIEPLLTLTAVALKLGVPVFKVRRAAKARLFPTYTLFNNRKLVRLSEVLNAIERSRSDSDAPDRISLP
ncbi:hypothetical protein J2R76_005804 [Bradyrhizobium sp. USDA 4532]|nr:hypothetical protein [Bradyrhizobium sp. USDA 4545]MCP1922213.1 hypothetical protein [Bradyrhizobium sp. USDA 4532]